MQIQRDIDRERQSGAAERKIDGQIDRQRQRKGGVGRERGMMGYRQTEKKSYHGFVNEKMT